MKVTNYQELRADLKTMSLFIYSRIQCVSVSMQYWFQIAYAWQIMCCPHITNCGDTLPIKLGVPMVCPRH